jgi:hypothetical protein
VVEDIREPHHSVRPCPLTLSGAVLFGRVTPRLPFSALVSCRASGGICVIGAADWPLLPPCPQDACGLVERLPKALIHHHNVPGQPVHEFLRSFDAA